MIFPRSSLSVSPRFPATATYDPDYGRYFNLTLLGRFRSEDDIADSARGPFIFHGILPRHIALKWKRDEGRGVPDAPFSRDGEIMSLKYISGIIVWFMFMTSRAIFVSSARKNIVLENNSLSGQSVFAPLLFPAFPLHAYNRRNLFMQRNTERVSPI